MAQDTVIVRCPNCNAKNRVPSSKLNDRAVCGKCKRPLPFSSFHFPEHPVDVTDRTFQHEVLEFPGPVVVQFWTPRCGYCRSFAPTFEEMAGKFAGRIKFVKLNTDQNSSLMSNYDIRGTPTVLLFRNSRLIDRIPGAVPKEEFERHLRDII